DAALQTFIQHRGLPASGARAQRDGARRTPAPCPARGPARRRAPARRLRGKHYRNQAGTAAVTELSFTVHRRRAAVTELTPRGPRERFDQRRSIAGSRMTRSGSGFAASALPSSGDVVLRRGGASPIRSSPMPASSALRTAESRSAAAPVPTRIVATP